MNTRFCINCCLKVAGWSLLPFIMISCASTKRLDTHYKYFDLGLDTIQTQQKDITIQANDLLSIQVFSKTLNQDQAAVFNMPPALQNVTFNNGKTDVPNGYQVSSDGNITMPVLGNIKAAGLTRNELQSYLVKELNTKGYVKDPSVIVRFLQFNINVIGEVRQPGTQRFAVDRVTIVDALSAAGDLTDYGKRENITVIRGEGDKKVYYTVDITKKDVFASPGFIMKPNDIVYVSPTKNKIRTLARNPDADRNRSVFFSILSSMVGIATIIVWSTRR